MAGFGGSLVSNILQKASVLDERVIDENINKITKKSSQLKGEILELIKQQYIDFDSYVNTTLSLEQQLKEVMRDYQRLSARVDQDLKGRVAHTAKERPEIESKLKETQERITLVQNLVAVYHGIETARKTMTPENYVSCADHLHDASEALQTLCSSACESKVYRALKSELAGVVSELSIKLREEWSKSVSWKPKTFPDNPKVLTSIELRVTSTTGLCLDNVVKAMQLLAATNVWSEKVKMFAHKLLEMLIRPLITHKTLTLAFSKENASSQVIKVVSSDKQTESIADLYRCLTTLFTAVQQILSESHQQKWMSAIGDVVCVEMCELIIAHRLSTAIPKDSNELAQYGELSSKTAEFETNLVDLRLVSKDSCQKLSNFTKDVNSHFAAQKSQDLLAHAREVLMKPLHDTVTITQANPLDLLAGLTTLDPTPPKIKTGELSSLKFSFPTCAISKSVQEYIDLLYSTLRECVRSPPHMSLQLFNTARNMVDLFCAVLPSYHKQAISDIPRAAIVQHNNYVYLTHHLITLGHQFHSHLPAPLNSEVTTFVDQVPLVRQLGEQVFVSEMRKQSGILVDALKSCGGFDNVSEDVRSQMVRQGIQQAQLHIVKLSQVYAEVLPNEIHCKSIGALLNVIATGLVRNILALEDIAMDDATELHAILHLVLERGPLALSSDKDTQSKLLATHCKGWAKLTELAMVLDASLQKIVESWEGGELAQVFSPVEIRGLIKALFKNTDRRAVALAKITL